MLLSAVNVAHSLPLRRQVHLASVYEVLAACKPKLENLPLRLGFRRDKSRSITMFKQISGAILCTVATIASFATTLGVGLGGIAPGLGIALAGAIAAIMVVGFQWVGE